MGPLVRMILLLVVDVGVRDVLEFAKRDRLRLRLLLRDRVGTCCKLLLLLGYIILVACLDMMCFLGVASLRCPRILCCFALVGLLISL
jgi:hypothetical protein